MNRSTVEATDWRRPRVEEQGLQRYLATLRARLGLIVATILVTTGAAIAYLAIAEKSYEAEADMLVTPVASDQAVPGAGLISESPDPTRDVETAARLITQRDVAQRVVRELGLQQDPEDLLEKVEAAPVAQSNIVSITATADAPEVARDIANGFGAAVVEERTAQFHAQLDRLIAGLTERVAEQPAGTDLGADSLQAELSRYVTLREGNDPTISVETQAATPDEPASPRPTLTLLAGLLSGTVLGIGGAFALHALDPRLRREEQLRNLYRVPVLARIPRETRASTSARGSRRFRIGPRRRRRRALGPGQLSPVTLEAYRTLRTMLGAHRSDDRTKRSMLITGPSPSEGKTTTAINLASSFALAGQRVILIEADFRRPTVGEALGVRPPVSVGKVLLGNATLGDALVSVKPFGESLRVLLADRSDAWLPEVLSLPSAGQLLEQARELCDCVVIDSPPLTEVIDALPFAREVDDVVVVLRMGSSRLTQLARLSDLLAQNDIEPSGFALVGVGTTDKDTYYLSAQRGRLPEQLQRDALDEPPSDPDDEPETPRTHSVIR